MGNALKVAGAGFEAASFDQGVIDASAVEMLHKGIRVDRATAALPQTATAAIFTVTGRVLLTSLVGEVTTVIQTQADSIKLQANPTAAGSSVDLCATLNVSAKAVATLLGITGTVGDAMVSGLAIAGMTTPLVVQEGSLDLVASASNTGSVKWQVHYVPLSDDGAITAA